MYCSLWAYSTVFANSLSARLPVMSFFSDGKDGYSTITAAEDGGLSFSVYLLLFAMITVPSSMLELSEQVFVQVALSICRVGMLLVMIVTIVLAPIQQKYSPTVVGGIDSTQIFGPLTPSVKPLSSQPSSTAWRSLESFHMNKIYLMLPMAGFAFIFHHSIPAISHPVKNKHALGESLIMSVRILSMCSIKTPCQENLLIQLINTPCQDTLSRHLVKTPCQYTLSIHLLNTTVSTIIKPSNHPFPPILTPIRLDLHYSFAGMFCGLHVIGLHCLVILW